MSAHLILIGLPGSGKSSIGRRVARQLRVGFVDIDEEIERLEGRSIADVFAVDGEAYFRQRERDVTAALRERPPMVVAPGGGWPMDPRNPALLRPPGRIVYLRVSPAVAVRRMGPGVRRRPLLAGDHPVEALGALLRTREAVYAAADVLLDTNRRTHQQIATMLREVAADLWNR